MSAKMQTWYDFVLQQMAAESYLDQIGKNGNDAPRMLMLGSNNPGYLQDNKLPLPTAAVLNGNTRMTESQATDFTTRYTIVSHLPNTASGFSATLMKYRNTATGTDEYTLSMRSTEYFNESQGGDWQRDGLQGADGEIGDTGFAFGQIASMESYYEHLKRGESYNASSGQWVSDPTLVDFKNKFGAIGTGGVLNVTGYSLSGQLADVFKELHPEVAQACVFNATGMGDIGQGSLQAMVSDFRQRLATAGIDLSVPSNDNVYAFPATASPTMTSPPAKSASTG